MRYAYPVQVVLDEDGMYCATARDVPEALTEDATLHGCLQAMGDALGAALAGYSLDGRALPVPSSSKSNEHVVPVPPLVAAKLALRSAMRAQQVNNTTLAMRLEVSEGAVRRLVNPDHASRLDRVLDALAALGQSLIVEDQLQEPPDSRPGGSQRLMRR